MDRLDDTTVRYNTKSINKLLYLNSDILAKSSRKAELGLVII